MKRIIIVLGIVVLIIGTVLCVKFWHFDAPIQSSQAATKSSNSTQSATPCVQQTRSVGEVATKVQGLPSLEELMKTLPLVDSNDSSFRSQLALLRNQDAAMVAMQKERLNLDDEEIRYLTDLITLAHAAQLAYQRKICVVSQQNAGTIVYSIPSYAVAGDTIHNYIVNRASSDLSWGTELSGQYVALMLPKEMEYFGKYSQQVTVEEGNSPDTHPGYFIVRSYTTDIGPVSSTSFVGKESVNHTSGENYLFIPNK